MPQTFWWSLLQCWTQVKHSISDENGKLPLMSWQWTKWRQTLHVQKARKQKRKKRVQTHLLGLESRGHMKRHMELQWLLLPKAKKGDEAEERSMKLRKNNVRAPKQFISFFPLVSQTYFKWQPQLSRVGVEFADKERFLDSALHPYFYFPTFFFFIHCCRFQRASALIQWGFERDQRTRTQKWYVHKDKDKERKSKLDALEEVFRFIHMKYHKLWCDEPDYDASYVQPTRADLEAALLEMESAQASWIATPNGVSSGQLNCYSKWSQLRPVELLLQMESAQASWHNQCQGHRKQRCHHLSIGAVQQIDR